MFYEFTKQVNKFPVHFWIFLFVFIVVGTRVVPPLLATRFPQLFNFVI